MWHTNTCTRPACWFFWKHIHPFTFFDRWGNAHTNKYTKPPSQTPLRLCAFPRASVEAFTTWRIQQVRLLFYSLFLSPRSGPTWLSACFPWWLPASVPRQGGGGGSTAYDIFSTPEGRGPAVVPSVHWLYRKNFDLLLPNRSKLLLWLRPGEKGGWVGISEERK